MSDAAKKVEARRASVRCCDEAARSGTQHAIRVYVTRYIRVIVGAALRRYIQLVDAALRANTLHSAKVKRKDARVEVAGAECQTAGKAYKRRVSASKGAKRAVARVTRVSRTSA